MKKAILVAMLVLGMATAAFAGTEEDQINPQRAKLEQLSNEVHAINQDAVILGESALLAPVSVGSLVVAGFAFPHRYIEAGDNYAQAIPGTVGRYAARASLAPFRLAAFPFAWPWYGFSYLAGVVGPHL